VEQRRPFVAALLVNFCEFGAKAGDCFVAEGDFVFVVARVYMFHGFG
jgi:hypothetical protein